MVQRHIYRGNQRYKKYRVKQKFHYEPYWSEGGFSSVTYQNSPRSLNNSYIVYDPKGKIVYQKVDDDSLGKFLRAYVVKNSIVITGVYGVKKLDFKGKQLWFTKKNKNNITKYSPLEGLYMTDNGDLFTEDDRKISKLDFHTGKILWTFKVNSDAYGYSTEFNPKTQNFYIRTTDTSLVVMNNDKIRWKVSIKKDSLGLPIIVSNTGTAAVVMNTGNSQSLNVYSNEGKLKWQYKIEDHLDPRLLVFDKNENISLYDRSQIKTFDSKGNVTFSFNLDKLSSIITAPNDNTLYILYDEMSYSDKRKDGEFIRKYDKKGKLLAETKLPPLPGFVITPSGVFTYDLYKHPTSINFYKFT